MTKRNAVTKVSAQFYGAPGITQLLTVEEAANFLRCSKSSLDKWRLSGDGPSFVRVGSRVRYRVADLLVFVEKSTRISTSDSEGSPAQA
jgi:excisionase family DNA binding protein